MSLGTCWSTWDAVAKVDWESEVWWWYRKEAHKFDSSMLGELIDV